MEHSRRHFRTNIQGNPTGTEEEETQTTGNINKQQYNQSGQKKHKNCRYKKPNIPITNLSNYELSKDQVTLLTKGLNSIPTSRKDHSAKILQDILLCDRKTRLKYHFYHNSDHSNSDTSQDSNSIEQPTNIILYPSSGWTPPSGQDPFQDTYRNSIINEFLKELDHPKLSRKRNLTNKEYQAMRDLHNNPDINIKPADKGGSIVIMNTVDYVKETLRQLFNQEHYKTLDKDLAIPYNRYIHHLIDQAWRMGIIDETTKENLQTRNPKITPFYLLPKIHKPNNTPRQTYS